MMIHTKIDQQMDPRLQYAIARRHFGIAEAATVSTEPNEIAVIAKVTNLKAWEELSEVKIGAVLGEKEEETYVVTGRIPVSRVEQVRSKPFVVSLKAAQPLKPALADSTLETLARPDKLPQGSLSNGGADVVVGIIDYGCDFAHENFRGTGGKTRLLCIWHQGGATTPTSPFTYGREYSAAEIDAALTQRDPYTALGYGPAPDSPRQRGTHGTHVMDIAAGNGRGSGVPGMAPQADLVFVDVSHADIPFMGPEVVGSRFGDSTRLLEAVRYIFDKAGNRPCVINISLGTNGGPHDGSTLVEEGIDRAVRSAPNRAVVIAASNSFDDGIHAAGRVAAGGQVDLVWEIPPNDQSQNEFELWCARTDQFALEVIQPDGTSLGIVEPGQNGSVNTGEHLTVFAANRLGDPNNGDNMIGIYLAPTAPSGAWTVRLLARTISAGDFHAWIERDNLMPSRFAPPHDNTHTIGSISCGRESIVVGSYDAKKPSKPISFFSSSGPTRDRRQKPEISAPGHGVLAAHSRTRTGVVPKSGTSMAAPAVCGIVALVFGEARRRGLSLSSADTRAILIAAARSSPPAPAGQWDPRYGNGRINASAAVDAVIQRAPAADAASREVAEVQPTRTRRAAGGRRKRA